MRKQDCFGHMDEVDTSITNCSSCKHIDKCKIETNKDYDEAYDEEQERDLLDHQ